MLANVSAGEALVDLLIGLLGVFWPLLVGLLLFAAVWVRVNTDRRRVSLALCLVAGTVTVWGLFFR